MIKFNKRDSKKMLKEVAKLRGVSVAEVRKEMQLEKIELKNETVNNGTGQGSCIEHIDLAFPVYYGECKGTRIRMPEENTVETVILLSKLNGKQHIEV